MFPREENFSFNCKNGRSKCRYLKRLITTETKCDTDVSRIITSQTSLFHPTHLANPIKPGFKKYMKGRKLFVAMRFLFEITQKAY